MGVWVFVPGIALAATGAFLLVRAGQAGEILD